jgi:hypothetical protein
MKPKQRIRTGLHDEWTGTGNFSDVYSGIEGRNNQHDPILRKHLYPHMNSWKARTAEGNRAYAKEQGMDIHDACAAL